MRDGLEIVFVTVLVAFVMLVELTEEAAVVKFVETGKELLSNIFPSKIGSFFMKAAGLSNLMATYSLRFENLGIANYILFLVVMPSIRPSLSL